MKKINPAFLIAFLFIVTVSCKNASEEKTENKEAPGTNIIYILADDLGYADVGSYGQTKISTPNIDKLAEEGMLFTQHYSGSTVCAPSRSALLTGLHTGHTGIRGNKEIEPEGQHPLKSEYVTMAEALKEAGYKTGAFGKWGLGFVGTEGDPNKQGFEEFYGYNCQRQAHRYFPEHLWHNDKKVMLEGNEGFNNTVTYSSHLIHDKALGFLEDNKDNPFFMFYPNVAPHAELIIPEGEMMKKYEGKFDETPYVNEREGSDYGDPDFEVKYYTSQPKPRTTFAAMVSLLDNQVGEIVQKLKDLNIYENTIIVFTSDNGPHREGGADPDFFDSNGKYRGYKRDLYEGGIRVPMIVSWPDKIEKGQTTDHISAFWDVFPTFAEVADAKVPENIDGISFLPELIGEEQKEHESLYWEFHEQGGKKAVRKGKWKAVMLNCFNEDKTTFELYDLSIDPSEENNIASENPKVAKELMDIMEKEHVENEDFPFVAGVKNKY
jgi:arylsulfatase A-like enzyme